MSKYISFGEFNKKYFLILGCIAVRIIMAFISGFTPYLTPNNTYFLFGVKSNFLTHPLITYIFQYFSLFVGGYILEFIFNDKKKNKDVESNSSHKSSFTQLVQKYFNNPIAQKYVQYNNLLKIDKKNYLRIFFVFSLYYYAKIAMTSFDNIGYNRVKYWPLEFIFLYIFSRKILNKIMYKHQKYPLIILLFACTTIYVINSFIPQSNKDCSSLSGEELEECEMLSVNIYNDISNKFGWYFIPIIIFIYLAAMISNAYSSIVSKWFMDIKYITLYRILIYLGAIGLFYSLILLFIFSNVPCSKEHGIISYICKLEYDTGLYYDNYKTLGIIEINSDFYIDIFIIIPIFIISSFLSILLELLIIKDLDPFYMIPIDCLYFLIYDIIDFCITYPITNLYRNLKFTCQVCSNVISVFLCCIYLEIIELHFCSLDVHLRRFIIRREQEEKTFILRNMSEFADLDNDENSNNSNNSIDLSFKM